MLYLADNLEAVTLVKRDVPWIGAFGIGREALLVAASKRVLHQQRAETLADPVWVGGNQWQIPMRLVRMVAGHSLQPCPRSSAMSGRSV